MSLDTSPSPASNPSTSSHLDAGDFAVEVSSIQDLHLVTVTGELDIATAPQLRETFTDVVAGSSGHVVVDLDRVSFIDSTGLGSLVAGYKALSAQSRQLALVCNSTRTRRLLEITGMTRLFSFHASPAEAAEALTTR